jgi:hypothetical protein
MGAIVANRAATRGGIRDPHGFVYGLTFGMKVSAAICFGAAIAAAALVRKYRHAEDSRPVEAAA